MPKGTSTRRPRSICLKEISQPQVGDVLIVQVAVLGIEDLAAESELAELPEIPEPGDEGVWAPSREDDDSMEEVKENG